MDSASMNRYEKQLYTVFKTFDVDNEEALDRSAVHELCDALQLEDRGAALVNTLFERRSDRVTFAQFRNGLLAVLGDAGGGAALAGDLPAQHSDDDSSGREVAPKFVFGSKKYGRRSRPPRLSAVEEPSSPRSSSASRIDSEDRRLKRRPRCRRSASAMESRQDMGLDDQTHAEQTGSAFEHDRRIDRDEALALCRGLSMDRIDSRLVERIFEDAGATDTTVGEFFDRLNASLTTTMEEATRESAPVSPRNAEGGPEDESGAGVPAALVVEALESAGVHRPRRLLDELGFAAPTLRPPELERALDDELRGLTEPLDESRDARAVLLVAALALNRLRLESTQRRAEVAVAERDKLRNDVAEANRRAGLLAQEVDESHARLESELRANLRRAEARHSDAARQMAADAAAERERAAYERARLEAELARRADAEARLRADASAAAARADELEALALAADERMAEAERERARLAAELRAAQARGATAARAEAEPGALAARLEELRHENKALRDRNDELCAELEARPATLAVDVPRGGVLSTELDSLLTHDRAEDCESLPPCIDQGIVGHVEAAARLRDIFESIDAIPINTDGRSIDSVVEDFRTLRRRVRELRDSMIYVEGSSSCAAVDAATQTEAASESNGSTAKEAVAAPRTEIAEAERRHEEEKRKLAGLVKELEIGLEQMRGEYDKCEEYWSGKLEEERSAHAAEQRLGDERLAELAAEIGEYERQFAARAALPTIDERHSLEAQFTDLEEEFARYRADAEAELEVRAERAARLAERVRALEAAAEARRRPRDYHNPAFADAAAELTRAAGGEVRSLMARTARAEAAARRLHARLAAADVLVQELYVENCQLAHRRPL